MVQPHAGFDVQGEIKIGGVSGAAGEGIIGQGAGNSPAWGTSVLPSGMIVMWHGTIANIPAGWVICDGNNSTPNLLAKFVEGVATAATDPGAGGGATGKATAGHSHKATQLLNQFDVATGDADHMINATYSSDTKTDTIADIRPIYYDVAFLMKT